MKLQKVNNLNGLKIFIAFFSLIFLLNIQSLAKELIIGFGQNKAPFVIGKTKQGLEIDIFREALAYKGHTMKVNHFSNRRLEKALINMEEIDAVATVKIIPSNGLYYVDKFIYFNNYAISKKKDNLKIEEFSDLKGLSIAIWQNAHQDLGAEFEKLFKQKPFKQYKKLYYEHHFQNSQNMMFWKGRVQVIIVDKTIFNWYRKHLSKEHDTTSEVTFHSIFPKRTYFQVAFKSKSLARDFEEGLKYIKRTGRYNQLYQKYIHQE